MDCRIGDDLTCQVCGLPASSARVRRNCRPGLGDMVADGLAAVGITKARAQAVASVVGIKDCGCAKRQAAMNSWANKHLGMPPGRAATRHENRS